MNAQTQMHGWNTSQAQSLNFFVNEYTSKTSRILSLNLNFSMFCSYIYS